MFLDQAEIGAVKAKVAVNQEPWKSVYNQMISAANAALSQFKRSVADNGGGAWGGNDPHKFSTDGTKDGSWGSRQDYDAASDMSQAILNLGLG